MLSALPFAALCFTMLSALPWFAVPLDSPERSAAAAAASTAQEMWDALGTDSWVVVPIESTVRPGHQVRPAGRRAGGHLCLVWPVGRCCSWRCCRCCPVAALLCRGSGCAAHRPASRSASGAPTLQRPCPRCLPACLPACQQLEGTRLTMVNLSKGPAAAAAAEADGLDGAE